jgi:hypothetical protein
MAEQPERDAVAEATAEMRAIAGVGSEVAVGEKRIVIRQLSLRGLARLAPAVRDIWRQALAAGADPAEQGMAVFAAVLPHVSTLFEDVLRLRTEEGEERRSAEWWAENLTHLEALELVKPVLEAIDLPRFFGEALERTGALTASAGPEPAGPPSSTC